MLHRTLKHNTRSFHSPQQVSSGSATGQCSKWCSLLFLDCLLLSLVANDNHTYIDQTQRRATEEKHTLHLQVIALIFYASHTKTMFKCFSAPCVTASTSHVQQQFAMVPAHSPVSVKTLGTCCFTQHQHRRKNSSMKLAVIWGNLGCSDLGF